VTAKRDLRDALEDILENMKLARRFLGDSASTDQIEEDPKTLYSVVRALEVVLKTVRERIPGLEPRIRALRDRLAEPR
jgi:uncharacterized protein with HEPN domain